MVNLSGGAKMKIGLHIQVMQVHTCFYRYKRADESIHLLSGRDFMSLIPRCKNCTVSLTKTLASEMASERCIGVVALEVEGCPS